MSMNQEENFRDIVLRPHWMQYCLCKMPEMLLCIASCAFIPFIENETLRHLDAVLALLLLVYLAYSITDMYRIRYIITAEQILYKHGVFSYTTDYIELYRVLDYQQLRSPLQQMTGLKTVVVLSNDRMNPVVNILGMRNEQDVVAIIRRRVEYNKLNKNVYEIANRY